VRAFGAAIVFTLSNAVQNAFTAQTKECEMSRPVNQAPGALRDFNTLPANTYLPCREVLSDLHQATDAQKATGSDS